MLQSKGLWHFGLVLGLLAAALHLAGYVLYGWGIWRGAIHTNPFSWGLWVLGAGIAYGVFREIAHDWVKSLLNLVCTLGMLVICGMVGSQYILGSASLTWDTDTEINLAITVLDIFVMFIWILFRKRSLNVLDFWFQVDIFVSFLPIVRATHADPTGETLLPWVLWTLAYTVQVFCVACRPADRIGDEVDEKSTRRILHTPLHYLFWHAIMVAMLVGGTALL